MRTMMRSLAGFLPHDRRDPAFRSSVHAQDLSRYRNFSFGMSLADYFQADRSKAQPMRP